MRSKLRVYLSGLFAVALVFVDAGQALAGSYSMPSYMNANATVSYTCGTPFTYNMGVCHTVYLTMGSTHTLNQLDSNQTYAYFTDPNPKNITFVGGDFCDYAVGAVGGDDKPKSGAMWSGATIVEDTADANYLNNSIHFRPGPNTYPNGMSVADYKLNGATVWSGRVNNNGCTGASPTYRVTRSAATTYDPATRYYRMTISSDVATGQGLYGAPGGQGSYTGLMNNYTLEANDPAFVGFGYVPYTGAQDSNVGLNPAGHVATDYTGEEWKRYDEVVADFYTGPAVGNNQLRWYDLDQTGLSAVPCPNTFNGATGVGGATNCANANNDPYSDSANNLSDPTGWGVEMELVQVNPDNSTVCPAGLNYAYSGNFGTPKTVNACSFYPPTNTPANAHDFATFSPAPNTHYRWIFHRLNMQNVIQFAVPYPSVAPLPPQIQLRATGSPGIVYEGSSASVNFDLLSVGSAWSGPGTVEILYPGASVDIASAGQAGITPGGSAGGFVGGPAWGFPGGANWVWHHGAIAPGSDPLGSLTFNVTAAAAVGTMLNMEVYWMPDGGVLPDDLQHVTVQFRVVSVRRPVIYGGNSDAHAGSCATGTGNVTGTGASVGEYVISAAGMITGVASSNGTNLLNMNGYTSLCRANLYTTSWPDYGAPASQYITSSSFDVSGRTGVWYYDGASLGTLNLTGTVSSLLTIVTSGNVRIANNMGLAAAPIYGPHDVPSLGIIANGDIYIAPGVTQADAYMFANGTIYTCEGGGLLCNNNLKVNGFLMGSGIQFGRLGPLGTNGAPIAEYISMSPNIYLNPPRYFDASIDKILLEGQGERAPLY